MTSNYLSPKRSPKLTQSHQYTHVRAEMTPRVMMSSLMILSFSLLMSCALSGDLREACAQETSPHVTPTVDPAAGARDAMPETGIEALAIGAQRDLTTLMKEGPCPCDPSQTMFQCIQARSCPAATGLARYGVELYKQGLGSDQVAEMIIKRFIAEFTPPVEFKLEKTPWKGSKSAQITIVEFADFECPHCALMGNMLKEVLKQRPGAVKVYFKQFPLPFHKVAPIASQATLAAHRQGMFWPMHDLIFKHQAELSVDKITSFAEELNLNMMLFRSDLMSAEIRTQVEAEHAEGVKAGLQGTPTLFFNGKMYTGKPETGAIIAHIDALLQTLGDKSSSTTPVSNSNYIDLSK